MPSPYIYPSKPLKFKFCQNKSEMSKRRKTVQTRSQKKKSLEDSPDEMKDEEVPEPGLKRASEFQLEVFNMIFGGIRNALLGKKKSKPLFDKLRNKKSNSEKIDLLIKEFKLGSSFLSNYLNPIRVALDKVLSNDLHKIYRKHFGLKKKLSKSVLVREVLHKFYGVETPLEKREQEYRNIQTIGNLEEDEEYRFFQLCDFVIPAEILEQVLDYLPRNYSVLTNIGATCQHLYLKLLTSWKTLRITTSSLHKVSTLALNNAQSIDLYTITQTDQNYLWKNLSSKRLRTLRICGAKKDLRSVLNTISKLRKKTRPKGTKKKKRKNIDSSEYPFENLQHLEVAIYSWGKNARPLNCNYEDLFPKLRSVRGLQNEYDYSFVAGCKNIREYGCDLLNRNNLMDPPPSWNLVLKNFEDKSSVETLTFCTREHTVFSDERFKGIFKDFRNLKKIKMSMEEQGSFRIANTNPFPFGEIFGFDDDELPRPLEKVIITNSSERKMQSTYFHQYLANEDERSKCVPVTLLDFGRYIRPFLMIKDLEVYGSVRRGRWEKVLDFNLEEMFGQKFFEINVEHHMKKFRGDIPLGSRSKRVMVNKSTRDLLSPPERKEEGVDMKKMRKFGNDIELVVSQFLGFISDTMLKFDRFEISVRSRDLWFEDERILVRFDRNKGVFRVKIRYIISSERGLEKEDCELFSSEEEEEEEFRFQWKEKRPCLLLFKRLFLKNGVLDKLVDKVGVIELAVGKESEMDRSLEYNGNDKNLGEVRLDILMENVKHSVEKRARKWLIEIEHSGVYHIVMVNKKLL